MPLDIKRIIITVTSMEFWKKKKLQKNWLLVFQMEFTKFMKGKKQKLVLQCISIILCSYVSNKNNGGY